MKIKAKYTPKEGGPEKVTAFGATFEKGKTVTVDVTEAVAAKIDANPRFKVVSQDEDDKEAKKAEAEAAKKAADDKAAADAKAKADAEAKAKAEAEAAKSK